MGSDFHPSVLEQALAQEAYISYGVGVAILNNPTAPNIRAIHGREIASDQLEPVVVQAETMILDSLKSVIRYSHPHDTRGYLAKLENQYDQAVPHMKLTVDEVYKNQRERMDDINTGLALLRPAPFLDPVVYRFICHGRLPKLTTLRLMGGFAASPLFEELLENRNLSHLGSKN